MDEREGCQKEMARPIAPDYGQQFLLPPALEDWVPGDHPARFLREFVDQLDLSALSFVLPPDEGGGRPPFAPSLLVKIWLYGYYHRIRSTRKLEAACGDHLPLLWLTGLIAPDHNSLWRFWRDNKKALRGIFKQTVQLAVQTGCVGLALQALDGTRIEAAASGHTGWSKEYMEKMLARLDAALDDFELKVVAENADAEKPGYRLPAGLAECQTLREKIKKGLAQLAADRRHNHHPVEPEARRMKLANGTNRFAYNAQAVADEQEGIIVASEVTRAETDSGQLVPMIEQARQNVGPAALETTILADGGYGGGADIQAAVEKPMDVLVPPSEGGSRPDHPYAAKHFHYDALARTVTCPREEKLDYQGKTIKRERVVERYRCHCRDCPVRSQCTSEAKRRSIEIWPHTPAVQEMRKRLATDARWRRRGRIIERPFAQIKQHDGFRRWTVGGLENVRVQWSLLCTTLNLRVLYRRWKNGRNAAGAMTTKWTKSESSQGLLQNWRRSIIHPLFASTAFPASN
jgi:transposase